MASFVMMQPPATASGEQDLPIAVRDGFSWFAFLIPPLWFAWNRLWVEAAVALAVLIALNAVGIQSGMEGMASLLSLLVSLWAGLEGAVMRIAGLRRRGFAELGAVEAANRDDAELRFAAEAEDEAADIDVAPAPMPRPAALRPHSPAPAIGLVNFQGRR